MQAPPLDRRTRAEVLAQALRLAAIDVPASWPGYVPDWAAAAAPDDPGRRMIELFSRLAELLIERLNRVPEKNFLAFLDLAGVEQFPGAPAEVPVTFLVSKRAVLGGVVPAGTQVATTQTKTATARVYETRSAFFATRATLERIIALHPGNDRFVELPVPALPPTVPSLAASPAVDVLTDDPSGMTDVAHVLYIASEALFARKDTPAVQVTIDFADTVAFPAVIWRRFDKPTKSWVTLPAPSVGTSVPNRVVFLFSALSGVGKVKVNGVEDFWLAASLDGDPDPSAALSSITQISGSVVTSTALPPAVLDAAFYNAAPLDVSRPFLPFGQRPAYGDALYLASSVGFAPDNDSVTLQFTIRPYSDTALQTQFSGLPTPPPTISIRTIAHWQYLRNDGAWVDLATYDHELTFGSGTTPSITRTSHTPTTGAGEGTFIGTSGTDTSVQATFTSFPNDIALRSVNGVESRWLRVLLTSESPYGFDGVLTGTGSSTRFIGPLFIPPRVESMAITYVPEGTQTPITQRLTLNDFEWRAPSSSTTAFVPFRDLARHDAGGLIAFGSAPALYLGLDRQFETAAFVSLFVDLAGFASSLSSPLEGGSPNVAWEYWSAAGWRPLDTVDQTLNLTTSGTVAFVAPDDSTPLTLFAQTDPALAPDDAARWWLRARLAGGHFDYPPRVRGVYLNSVMAENRSTFAELLVGSSNAEPNQTFALVKAPVLAGELWVREPERPTRQEEEELEREQEEAAGVPPGSFVGKVVETREVVGSDPEVFVWWLRVPNFELSGTRSRHYLLDAVKGSLTFGGQRVETELGAVDKALIPPALRDNLVLRGFRTGGGAGANRETGPLAVKELKTSLPFIDRVFNVQAASGGASEWSPAQLQEFGPQVLKNRGRAVTTEDYQWLILQRFSEVARARCLAVRAPGPGGTLTFKAGGVTALIVPSSADPRPQPSQGLISRVREFLRGTVLANIVDDVHVKGPDYVAVDIEAELVPTSPDVASVVLRQAEAALEAFLHPLTGGEDHSGYGFGRPVHLSEVHAVLERIEGVDYVVSAHFTAAPGADAFVISGDRLASSGTHRLTIVAGEI